MRSSLTISAAAAALVAGFAMTPVLYAQGDPGSPRSEMEPGMMGGMMGMMGSMQQMSRMMDRCATMMSGGGRPNDQWRKDAPETPEKGS